MKEQFFSFQIDFIKPVTLIIKSLECDARTDAYTIIFKEFGKSARILGEAKKIRRLPRDARPVKLAEKWAWTVLR